jgi:tetratricopeptide (TPR) repeat protein
LDWFADRVGAAAERYELALALARELSMRSAEAIVLGNWAAIVGITDTRRAITMRRDALAIATEMGDRQAMGTHLANLSTDEQALGDFVAARASAEAAIECLCTVADRWGEARARLELGGALRRLGDFEGAHAAIESALAITIELRDPYGECDARQALGRISFLRHDLDAARRYHSECAALGARLRSPFIRASAFANLGEIELRAGQPEAARSYLEQSRALYVTAERPDRVADIDGLLEKLRLAEGAGATA